MPLPKPALLPLAAALALGACAGDQAAPTQVAQAGTVPPVTVVASPIDPSDPFEATNRQVLDFNWALDDAVIKPIAKGYRQVLGPWPRDRIRNVLDNLNEPVVAANRLLQGRPIEAGTSIMRFVVNSTLGLGGLFDLAPIGGPPKQVADLGQTFHAWGLPDGPFLMLPFVGPSTPRELAGLIGNGFMNPIGYPTPFTWGLGRAAASGLDERERNIGTIEDLRANSIDVYARLKNLWRQNRDAELGLATVAAPDILEDPEAPAPSRRPAPATGVPQAARLAPARPPQKAAALRKAPGPQAAKVAAGRKPARQILARAADRRG
ncbi:MlaA family lipoprotein [Roseicella aquatilis]|nr:VacJ family lipoprotein [Roseicella aquatilis]